MLPPSYKSAKYKTQLSFREELRGISRGKDAKDVDWEAIAGASEEEEEEEEEVMEKPKPLKIAVSEVLKRARKPSKKGHKSVSNKKGVFELFSLKHQLTKICVD